MSDRKPKIGIVFGGRSCEHEVSLASATSVIQNLDADKYEIIPIAITKEGSWLWGIEPQQMLQAQKDSHTAALLKKAPQVTLTTDPHTRRMIGIYSDKTLPDNGVIDVFFPVLHGPYGEDGTIQGLFEMANIPYVGCDVLASAVGMDKEIMKVLFQATGLPIVRHLTFRHTEWKRDSQKILDAIENYLSYPCFTKPANLGSSVGVNKATHRQQLAQNIELAFTFDRKVIIEEGIDCREFSCAILGNEDPEASVVGEILPGDDFSDYNDKYINHTIQFVIPAHIPQANATTLRSLALQAYKALDLNGLARVDFFQDKVTGHYYINEVNTLPGCTSMSLYPRLWHGSGLAYRDLLDRLIELALEYYNAKQCRQTALA